ncbi:hypothetical protein [Luteibacter yeojuensis]|uniref:Uncharacterized protein n=1 Tax=Luteibacter yeojuensis TaxID=345309 RepID=A0A0F3KXL1_9GAMM|nr:hypothetical protein [Luteibacter yeojuensis]KJV35682.1 hypothetical protein VI08_06645 [Luteibacter yeojuensis]
MNLAWSDIKEVFFTIGSVAGVFAALRPILESRFQRDQERIRRVFEILPEQMIIELESSVYTFRRVSSDDFNRFSGLIEERRANQNGLRFTGPLRERLRQETDSLLHAYKSLRELIQVPWWQPHVSDNDDGTKHYSWDFNRSAFTDFDQLAPPYAKHLDQCGERAETIRTIYQRLQVINELHFLEVPLASYLLKRRFRNNGLDHT